MRLIVSLLLSLSCVCGEVLANGFLTTTPIVNFDVNFTGQEMANKAGALSDIYVWDLGGGYKWTATCPDKTIADGQPIYFMTQLTKPTPLTADGFYILNEYLEMKVELLIGGKLQQYVQTPLNNQSNLLDNYRGCKQGGQISLANANTGSKGKLVFRLRKPIINGIQVSNTSVMEVYGRMGTTTLKFGPVPIVRINITSNILKVPEKCTINNGQMVQMEFGDLPQRGLNGVQFAKKVPLSFICQGGIFDNTVPLKINMALSGKGASFNQSDLRTTRDDYQGSQVSNDLAIRFTQLDGQPLPLNTSVPVTMLGNVGSWGFIAAPVQAGTADVAPGDFYATATIVAEFQ